VRADGPKASLTIVVICLLARSAAANPADIFGYGARGISMGGAQVAAADDSTASYYNPARLIGDGDIHIDIGYQLAAPDVETNDTDFAVDQARGLSIGIGVPGKIGGLDLAIGSSLFLPDQHLTRTRTLPPGQPRFLAYDNRPQRLLFVATGAIEIVDGLSIGGGVAYMSSTEGAVELHGLLGFPDADRSDFDLAIDVDLQTIRYPHAGIAWRVAPWLDVGASYRGGFRLVLNQGFDLMGDIGTEDNHVVEDGFLKLDALAQDLFQPAQFTVGAAARVAPCWLVALDVAWHRWSAFENPAAKIAIELELGQFNDFVDIPPQPELVDPDLHDIVVPRLGVEWLAAAGPRRTIRGRAGYVYEPDVAPPQTGETNFIDNDKHSLSIGAGIEWPGIGGVILRPLSLDAFVGLTVLAPRDHVKTSPIDPVGDYRSGGKVFAAGLSSRWRF
jgi:long-chain fatty acid transport protein